MVKFKVKNRLGYSILAVSNAGQESNSNTELYLLAGDTIELRNASTTTYTGGTQTLSGLTYYFATITISRIGL